MKRFAFVIFFVWNQSIASSATQHLTMPPQDVHPSDSFSRSTLAVVSLYSGQTAPGPLRKSANRELPVAPGHRLTRRYFIGGAIATVLGVSSLSGYCFDRANQRWPRLFARGVRVEDIRQRYIAILNQARFMHDELNSARLPSALDLSKNAVLLAPL